jgi:hypothetical protein
MVMFIFLKLKHSISAAAAAAAAAANAAPQQPIVNPPRTFKPYGSPPPFDQEAERDSFGVWEERWKIFLALSTIDEVLDAAARSAYKTNQLKSCLSTPTLQAVLSARLTAVQLGDHEEIINLPHPLQCGPEPARLASSIRNIFPAPKPIGRQLAMQSP